MVKMEKKKTQIIYNGILILILVLFAASVVYWGSRKEGYHVDELYSYGLANSEYLPFMHFGEQSYSVKDWMNDYGTGDNIFVFGRNIFKDLKILKNSGWNIKNSEIYSNYQIARANSNDTKTTTWVSGEEYVGYLTAQKGSLFNYASVYYNQRGDVHPPLFYLLLHTVSSFAPGVFSKWFGITVNALAILGAIFLLYKATKEHFGGPVIALLVVATYAFSSASVSTTVFLRMYALLTFMIVGMVYAHLAILGDGWEIKKNTRILLIVFTICGYLTHYYFVIFAIGIALVALISMLVEKKWKNALSYFLTMAACAVCGIAVWPFSIKHVFFGYRGQESLSSMSAGSFVWDKSKVMLMYLMQNTVYSGLWILAVAGGILLAALIWFFVKNKKEKKAESFLALKKILLLLVPCALYFLTVPQMIPFLTDRYIMCIYPWVFVLFIAGLGFFIKNTGLPKTAGTVVCILLAVFLVIHTANLRRGVMYLYTGGQENDSVPENTDCIYILEDNDWNESAEETLLLSKCREVAVTYKSNLPVLDGTYNPEPGSHLLLVFRTGLDEEAYSEAVFTNTLNPENGCTFKEEQRKEKEGHTLVLYSIE